MFDYSGHAGGAIREVEDAAEGRIDEHEVVFGKRMKGRNWVGRRPLRAKDVLCNWGRDGTKLLQFVRNVSECISVVARIVAEEAGAMTLKYCLKRGGFRL